jgi:hypothetical protein
MNKLIIGSLAGGILLFMWQFLSWAALNLHADTSQYTPKQDTILSFLETQLEPGFYFLPNTPPGTSSEEKQALMKSAEGKPWAQIYYHASMKTSMGMNMARGFLVDVIITLLLCWILLQVKDRNFKDTVLISLSIGLIGYLAGVYSSAIWFENPTVMDLVDAIVGFGLVGAWLGYYLKK